MTHTFPNGRTLRLHRGDITELAVDAIVNAANSQLRGGGGVDGAIHEAGGPSLLAELRVIRQQQGACPPGSAVVTGAGELPARFVFHAVGPMWRGGEQNEADTLASCYRTCLRLAREHGVQRISFPSISTGVYGYPVEQAASIAVRTVAAELVESSPGPAEIWLVQYDERTHEVYKEALTRYTNE